MQVSSIPEEDLVVDHPDVDTESCLTAGDDGRLDPNQPLKRLVGDKLDRYSDQRKQRMRQFLEVRPLGFSPTLDLP